MEMEIRKARNLTRLSPRPIEAPQASAVDLRKNEARSLVLCTLPVANPILMFAPFQECLPRSRHQVLCPFSAVLGSVKADPAPPLEVEINVTPFQVQDLLFRSSVFSAQTDHRRE
jgi:hypothetical protein